MKKIISLVIVMLFILSSCGQASFIEQQESLDQSGAADADYTVKLIFADRGGDDDGFYLYGYVEVENLAPEKSVVIHYTNDGETWADQPCTYEAATSGNHERWYFRFESKQFFYRNYDEYTFAVKYTVNGQEYWDNNSGENYYATVGGVIDRHFTALGSSNVLAGISSLFEDQYSGTTKFGVDIYINNIDYEKVVDVIYTTDNWQTTQVGNAAWIGNFWKIPSLEYWRFTITGLPADVNNVEFAVSYKVAGQTYWDNNFGNNYTLTKPEVIY